MTALSFQLYSSRDFPPLDKTLKMLAEIGYSETEGYPALYDVPGAVRTALDENNLAMPSAHFSVDALVHDRERTIRAATTLGVKSIYAPHLSEDERPQDREGYQAFAQQLEALSEVYGDAGFHFGWHNHAFEFQVLADGSTPMSIILNEAPTIGWEADIAWIVRGGGDPFRWIAEFGERISAVHIKDIAPAGTCLDEDGWADVGFGTMDWAGLLSALSGFPVRHFIMEHDKPNDDARFARRSFETVTNLQ